ncbi:hypothetical protein PoB_005077700 [Plakobranchus ocellatus]|uniref:Uncharacterized protein n=1 Tax=Plakobranchus ocellatus TaxID=259542 RepID=A0AAV4BYZ1_9GAST|nr:hypothetical protein PoB_005077700 [Plakobranchus ocellatus]
MRSKQYVTETVINLEETFHAHLFTYAPLTVTLGEQVCPHQQDMLDDNNRNRTRESRPISCALICSPPHEHVFREHIYPNAAIQDDTT